MQWSRNMPEPNMFLYLTFLKIILIKIKHKNSLKDSLEPYDPPD